MTVVTVVRGALVECKQEVDYLMGTKEYISMQNRAFFNMWVLFEDKVGQVVSIQDETFYRNGVEVRELNGKRTKVRAGAYRLIPNSYSRFFNS